MKYKELQDKTRNELQESLDELKVKLGKLKFELAGKSLKDVSQIKKTKKDVARILTAINKKHGE